MSVYRLRKIPTSPSASLYEVKLSLLALAGNPVPCDALIFVANRTVSTSVQSVFCVSHDVHSHGDSRGATAEAYCGELSSEVVATRPAIGVDVSVARSLLRWPYCLLMLQPCFSMIDLKPSAGFVACVMFHCFGWCADECYF